uniref:Bactericidal permeability-increasing protein n=1 Tax=Chrysolophus pictus TaxID=9089 RepID=A0A8C3LRM2_CHRPC
MSSLGSEYVLGCHRLFFPTLWNTCHFPSGADLVLMHIKFILWLYNIEYFALFTIYTVPVRVDDLAEIDYSLNSLEVFRPYIDMDLKGIVHPAGNYTGPPYVATPFAIPDQSDSMLYLAFSEYFFQTSLFSYYTAGAFNITIAKETCRYLNISTEMFGSIIPEIAKYSIILYPVMMKLMATEIPLISLQQDSFTLEIQESMEVFAVLPDSTTQSLFTVNVAANTSIALNVFDQKLTGSLCLNRLQFSLAHSNVGSFEVSRQFKHIGNTNQDYQ